jgi:hypothetical protein
MSPVEALGATAASIVAVGVIWQKGVRPMWRAKKAVSRAIHAIEQAGPVLLAIAEEFKPDHGESLRDRIDSIDHKADIAATAALEAKDLADDATRLVAETNARIVEELTSTNLNALSRADLETIEAYIHNQAHITRNALQAQVLATSNLSKVVDRIAKKLEDEQ